VLLSDDSIGSDGRFSNADRRQHNPAVTDIPGPIGPQTTRLHLFYNVTDTRLRALDFLYYPSSSR
jgi:hypothetical protein